MTEKKENVREWERPTNTKMVRERIRKEKQRDSEIVTERKKKLDREIDR